DFFKANSQWSGSTRRSVVNRVLASINHAVKEGKLPKNPISSTAGYSRSQHGTHTKRKGVVPPDLRRRLEDAAIPALRNVLIGLRESGARPSELRRARVEKVSLEAGYMLVPNKTARKTGEPERKIYLSPELKELIKGLIGGRTEGFVFLTARGKQWS